MTKKNNKMITHTFKKISDLKGYSKNPKVHPEHQIEFLKKSIIENGFYASILIDENNTIICGHGRVMAAKQAGLEEIHVVVLSGASEDEKKKIRIADNKSAEMSGWDIETLKFEIESFKDIDCFDIGFDNLNFLDLTDNQETKVLGLPISKSIESQEESKTLQHETVPLTFILTREEKEVWDTKKGKNSDKKFLLKLLGVKK